MPIRTDEEPRQRTDRDRQPRSTPAGTERNFETEVSDSGQNYDAPFDRDLNPIEEKDINTDGSER